MKVAVIDKGSTIPGGKNVNLALAKISKFHKVCGDEVALKRLYWLFINLY